MSDQADWFVEQEAEVRRIKAELIASFTLHRVNPGVAAVAMAETINLILRSAPEAFREGSTKMEDLRRILIEIIRLKEGD